MPVVARRRKSLGDMFQRAVKARLGRDKSSSSEDSPVCPSKGQSHRSSEDAGLEESTPIQLRDPPRLEVLSELPNINNLQRSSTFRTYLEKAASDINNKYGTVQSLPEARRARRRPSWRKTLPNSSRVVIPIPPRSYFRPRDESEPLPKTPSVRAATSSGDVVDTRSRHYKTCNRIPARQVDKILEESLSLRDPPDYASVKMPRLEDSPDRHLVPLLWDLEISKDQKDAPSTHDQKTDAHSGTIIYPAPSNTFGAHSSLLETINDFQNPECSFRSRNPSGSSWVTVQFSKEDLDLLAQLEKGRQETCACSEADFKADSMKTFPSLEVHCGSDPETPRVQAMEMPNSPDTFHLPPAALSHGLVPKEESSQGEQVPQHEPLAGIGIWPKACTPEPEHSRSSSNPPLVNPTNETKPSVVSKYCSSQSLENLMEVQSFVASRRRIFESSVGSLSDDGNVSADESGVSLGGAENLKTGKLGGPKSQDLGKFGYVGY